MHSLHMTHVHLQDASNSAYASNWAAAREYRDHLIGHARAHLVQALAGEDPSTSREDGRAALIETIAEAIIDATDIASTPETQAKAVLDTILDNCLAYPPKADSEALAAE